MNLLAVALAGSLSTFAADMPPAQLYATPEDRAHPIPAKPAEPVPALVPIRTQLSNGIKLGFLRSGRANLITMIITVPSATSDSDPATIPGLASMMASMMREGAGKFQTAIALENVFADYGIESSIAATRAGLQIVLSGYRDNFPNGDISMMFSLARQLILEPAFMQDSEEMEEAFKNLKLKNSAQIHLANSKAGAIANRQLSPILYPGHPNGSIATLRSINQTTLEDVRRQYRETVGVEGVRISVGGNISPEELSRLAESQFGQWPKSQLRPQIPAQTARIIEPSATGRLRVYLVNFPADKPHVLIGIPSLKVTDPQLMALTMAVDVLGGGQDGRLFKNIREVHHWSYGAYANLSPEIDIGAVHISAAVDPQHAGDSLREIRNELAKLRDEPLSQEKFDEEKLKFKTDFQSLEPTAESFAGRLEYLASNGLPDEQLNDFLARVDALTIQQVQDAAKTWLTEDAMKIIIVGQAADLAPQLRDYHVDVVSPNDSEISQLESEQPGMAIALKAN